MGSTRGKSGRSHISWPRKRQGLKKVESGSYEMQPIAEQEGGEGHKTQCDPVRKSLKLAKLRGRDGESNATSFHAGSPGEETPVDVGVAGGIRDRGSCKDPHWPGCDSGGEQTCEF